MNFDNLTVEKVIEIVELIENSKNKSMVRLYYDLANVLGVDVSTPEKLNNFISDFLLLINKYPQIFMSSTQLMNYMINLMKLSKEFSNMDIIQN
jgi:hypothetical protein